MARVLLVEDEPDIGGIIAFKLGREGHDVRWVREAAPAVEAADTFAPALALLDAAVQRSDAVLERLCRRCPVLVLTESRDVTAPARMLAAGAVATVVKPFKPTVLARTVNELIDRRTVEAMDDRWDDDLGVEQEERLEEEGPVEEAELEEDLRDVKDPELAEDLRRARPNPPLTTRRVPDPYSDIDRGYLEDEEGRDLTEEDDTPLELEPEDPFEADEEERDRPGRRT
ncbi:MAG TPA: response regulator [Candidatus Dormibacteraeota bacterium]|nr:response regulator [Candidatus Dormibacteraeota bacterium]